MELAAGDTLNIQFTVTKGSMQMKIKEPGGNTLYAGNGETVSDFTVNISKSGVYSIILCLGIHCNLYGICSKSGNRHQRTVWKHRAITAEEFKPKQNGCLPQNSEKHP